MRFSTLWCWLLVALLGCFGCVTVTKHEELQKKYDLARAQLNGSYAEVRTLKQALQESEKLANDLALRVEVDEAQLVKIQRKQADNEKLIALQKAEAERLRGELADLLKDRSRLKDSTDKIKQALLELAQRRAQVEQRVAEYKGILARFQDLIDAGTLHVHIAESRMVLVLPSDALFDSGSAELSAQGTAAIAAVGKVLAGMGQRRAQVEGHTDNVPSRTSSYASNWELAAARALVVVRALIASGVSSNMLSAASYGEFQPAASNDDERGRARNRRIEIVLSPDLLLLPGFEELSRAVTQPEA